MKNREEIRQQVKGIHVDRAVLFNLLANKVGGLNSEIVTILPSKTDFLNGA
jgi:hypothetical protein